VLLWFLLSMRASVVFSLPKHGAGLNPEKESESSRNKCRTAAERTMAGAAIGGIAGAATPAILGLTATGPMSGGAAAAAGAVGGGLAAGIIFPVNEIQAAAAAGALYGGFMAVLLFPDLVGLAQAVCLLVLELESFDWKRLEEQP